MPLHFRALIGVARQDEQESPVPEIISRKVVTNSWGMGVESRATKFGLKFDLRTRCLHIYTGLNDGEVSSGRQAVRNGL